MKISYKELACELHRIYDIVCNVRCPLELLQLVHHHSRSYKYYELQMSNTIRKPSCKPNCKTLYFFIVCSNINQNGMQVYIEIPE
jgi:hypothetical protein